MTEHAPFPRLVKRAHGFYRSLWEPSDPEIKRLFVELASSSLAFGRLQHIANETGVPYKTLQDWRAKLIENPFYCHKYPQKVFRRGFRRISRSKLRNRSAPNTLKRTATVLDLSSKLILSEPCGPKLEEILRQDEPTSKNSCTATGLRFVYPM